MSLDREDLQPYSRVFRLSIGETLPSLAGAIASTPGLPAVAVTARDGPRPGLAIWGEIDRRERRSLAVQAKWLADSIRDVRYVDPPEVIALCRILADRLRSQIGESVIRKASFRAIPRGGLFVLGHLAYLLDLNLAQLSEEAVPGAGLVVLVDDCSLTGDRLRRSLPGEPGTRVVFAHLLSPPGLRDAVEDTESDGVLCLASEDLEDLAAARLGAGVAEYRRKWAERLGSPRYWIGLPRPVVFPWGEPDRSLWDSENEEVTPAWRIGPPHLCLKNAVGGAQIQVQQEAVGPLRPAEDVHFLEWEERLYLAIADTCEVLELDGAGAAIWRSILRHGQIGPVLEDLQAQFEADVAALESDLRGLVEDLMNRGILVREEQ